MRGGVTSKFKIQTGETSGTGTIKEMPFKWKTSAVAEKTLDTQLRVNHFSSNQVEFLFEESALEINTLSLFNVNPASEFTIEFYDVSGALIPPGNVTVNSPDGGTGFPVSMDGNTLSVSRSAAGPLNCRMNIELTPPLRSVRRIVLHVKKDQGLLGICFKGTPESAPKKFYIIGARPPETFQGLFLHSPTTCFCGRGMLS